MQVTPAIMRHFFISCLNYAAKRGVMLPFFVLGILSGVATAQEQSPTIQGIAILPRDLSPWGMFLNADIVVKVVMVGLVFASLAWSNRYRYGSSTGGITPLPALVCTWSGAGTTPG